ncbi:MAG: hypothetical protein ACFCU8_12990 [Thermosynechococcaceae cyanobacterium]
MSNFDNDPRSNPENDPRYPGDQDDPARRDLDRRLQQERDQANTSRGLLIGVLASAVVGLGILVGFLLSQPKESDVVPTLTPDAEVSPTPSLSPTPTPEINIDIIQPPVDTTPAPDVVPSQPAPAPPSKPPAPPQDNGAANPQATPAPAAPAQPPKPPSVEPPAANPAE